MYINALYFRTTDLNLISSQDCQNSSSSTLIKINLFLLLQVSDKELKVKRMKKRGHYPRRGIVSETGKRTMYWSLNKLAEVIAERPYSSPSLPKPNNDVRIFRINA